MRRITISAVLMSLIAAFSARAQLQTLVDTSTVINVPSNGYAVISSAQSYSDADLQITMHGVPFDYRVGEVALNGFIFTGPATIQFQGSINNPSFATIDVASLRKAVGTNIQTLVVSPTNVNSATINVSDKSYAVIRSADTQSSATLSITIQGVLFTYALQDVSVKNLTFAGPATVQLQGDQYGPSFATVDVMPLRKSSKTQIETLVVSPTNTVSQVLNVTGKQYAVVRSFSSESGAVFSASVAGAALSFNDVLDESPIGFTFAGPAMFELDGNIYGPSFMTFEVGPQHK